MNAIESVCYGCVGAGIGGCPGCCNPTSEKFKECESRVAKAVMESESASDAKGDE